MLPLVRGPVERLTEPGSVRERCNPVEAYKLAQGLALVLTRLATRELGGKRQAQLVAALAVGIAGPSLFSGSLLSYTSFDYLWGCWWPTL